MTLLSISHLRQSQAADCLAACAYAVVVIDLDDEFVYVSDPYFADAPKEVPHDEFMLAWLEQDYWYSVIRLAAP